MHQTRWRLTPTISREAETKNTHHRDNHKIDGSARH